MHDTQAPPVIEAAPAPAAGPGRRWRLPVPTAMDRSVLAMYAATRAGVWLTAYCAGWLFSGDGGGRATPSLLGRWQQWDWAFYVRIAQHGYFSGPPGPSGAPTDDNREAFFPGFPLLLRAVHAVLIPDWTAAGLVISFVAGAVAVLALARIARLEVRTGGWSGAFGRKRAARVTGSLRGAAIRTGAGDGDAAGRHAVFYLLLSPCAVFLAAGYTEAVFLALALPCWLAARQGRWAAAGWLGCGACAVRVSGVFLGVALAVLFVTAGAGRRRWRQAGWLVLPAVPAAAYTWFLHAHTGDWMAWKHAQERGWYRRFHSPWQAWSHTWHGAFSHTQTTPYALLFQFELAGMVVGLALFGLLVWRRRWAEAVYLGLTLWALGTSYWYMSVPRASLLWWPLWTVAAGWTLRRPWLRTAYVAVAGPLMTVLTVAFTSGRWAG
ncbi:hypothetical protein [Actinacidiphila paucisporea]|uniref:Integral membrane protein n=1 Tax=Actinacidiphila paucisporea TaxID=310782 RepID=A0A1M6Z5T1_9ACTN|nr:hypothetical protein [Actinacidiphila paucisporea]SHL25659.1 hypothetical protein SAMN05216499_103226 [Actinacidiphila paucisporea]